MFSRYAPLPSVATTLALALALCVGGDATNNKSPNFLIYQADNMDLIWPECPEYPEGTSGSDPVPTPYIDRLRDEGVVFTRGYTSSPMCTPSRYSTLTGRYPSRSIFSRFLTNACQYWEDPTLVDVVVNSSKMQYGFDAENNIATVLKGLGYITGTFGKWHLSEYDNDNRSVEHYEYERSKAYLVGFDVAEAFYIGNMNDGNFKPDDEGYSHNLEWIVSETMSFFESSLNAGTPFFAYVNPTSPHHPSIVTAIEDFTIRHTASGVLEDDPDVGTMMTRQYIGSWKETYGDTNQAIGIMWMDDALGALLAFLEGFDALDDTVVLFLSDQGTLLTNSLFEHGVRVPFVVRYPPLFAPRSVDKLVSTIDILPTFVEIASSTSTQKAPQLTVDGKSFTELASTGASAEFDDRILFFEFSKNRAAVADMFKLIRRTTETCQGCWEGTSGCDYDEKAYPASTDWEQLYSFKKDPAEQTNVVGKKSFSSVLDRLNAALDAHIECTKPSGPADACIGPEPTPEPTTEPTPEPTPAPPSAYDEWSKGRCGGKQLEDMTSGVGLEDCFTYCKSNAKCIYFSYNAGELQCRIHKDCAIKTTNNDDTWTTYEVNKRRLLGLPESRRQAPSDPSPAQEVVM